MSQSEVAEGDSTAEPAIAASQESTSTSEPESSTRAAESSVIKSGSFVSGEHETSGGAQIIDDGDQFILELDETFQTSSMGPDLVVVLHRSEDVIGSTEPPAFPLQEGDYVFLAELESFSGAQRYAIPADVNLDDYQSAVIWCRRFNATFGAATLR
ncbi:DM13 domain-containing protein [Nodosilinea sp. AN01ver1]|uniref:DM13 domain-containing protein n=1 Tax=Nodosilinea sp. AN01ver1 TaxID=3423362 RepID=UPI003D31620B